MNEAPFYNEHWQAISDALRVCESLPNRGISTGDVRLKVGRGAFVRPNVANLTTPVESLTICSPLGVEFEAVAGERRIVEVRS